MTTYSMTGFAREAAQNEHGQCIIELKSVNSRYLDIYCRLPECAKPLEKSIRQKLTEHFARGKIECSMQWQPQAEQQFTLNEPLIENLLAATETLAKKHQLDRLQMGELLRLPNMLLANPVDQAVLNTLAQEAIDKAVNALLQDRLTEGQSLYDCVISRLEAIITIVGNLKDTYQLSINRRREQLQQAFQEFTDEKAYPIDNQRFEQELLIYLQKMDIAEEIDRLHSHVKATHALMGEKQPKGRKLDFLLQEMNREANTIASKAQHIELSNHAIELKVLLEQIREQGQNIE